MQAWVETVEGREALAALAELNKRLWPNLFQELTGIAAGAGLPFTQVWLAHPFGRPACPSGETSELLQHSIVSAQRRHRHQQQSLCALQVLVLNLRSEMGALLHTQVDDCSDVLLNLPDLNVSAVAHNEDMTTDAANHTYFVQAQQVGPLVSACCICLRLAGARTCCMCSQVLCLRAGGFLLIAGFPPELPVGLCGSCAALPNCDLAGCMQMGDTFLLCRAMCSGQPTPMQASCPPRRLVSTRQALASP